MKLLIVPLFAVLTIVAHADPYILPPVCCSTLPVREVVTIYEMPSHSVPHAVYTVAKPTESILTERTVAVPQPLGPLTLLEPLAPRFPPQMEEQEREIVRGQNSTVNELSGILGSPPPPAQGAVEEGTIEPKLLETIEPAESPIHAVAAGLALNPAQAGSPGQETKPTDPLGYTVLLVATAVTTIGLVYMAFVAYDYRQRWMQSLTMQNDRYLGNGMFDRGTTEDTYGTYGASPPFQEGLGLT